MLFTSLRCALTCTQGWGGPEGGGAEQVLKNKGTSPKQKTSHGDNWAQPMAVPNPTVDQPEFLQLNCNRGFVSMGCFSVTFPKGLEGMSTINIHPFQTVCSNIRLTARTSAILSHQQNDLSWRGQARQFSQMTEQGESRGQKLKPR